MVREVLIVAWRCENVFWIDFLFDFIFNQSSYIFDSFRCFFPLIVGRIIASYDNNIDIMDIFLNVIECLVQKFDGSITLDTSIRFSLDWLSFRESIFEMTADWEVTNSWGFLCVVKVEMNVGQMENFKVFSFGLI